MSSSTAPTQGTAQPDLTDEEIAMLERDWPLTVAYARQFKRLLAEVKRRRVLDVAATQARMEQHIEEERAAERRGWLAGREAAVFRLRAHPLAQAMVREIVPPAAEPLGEQRETLVVCDRATPGHSLTDRHVAKPDCIRPAPAGQQPTPRCGSSVLDCDHWAVYRPCGNPLPCAAHPQEQLGRKEGA